MNERRAVEHLFIQPLRLLLRLCLDFQMDCVDMRLQGAGPPERHVLAVAADVVPALLVHRLDVRLQVVAPPGGDARAVRARVIPALLRLDVRLQAARRRAHAVLQTSYL